MSKARLSILLISIAALAVPAMASAQNALGPPIPGICLFAREIAIAGSKAGQAANVRLQALGAGIETELSPEQKAIVAENDALTKGATTLPAAQRQPRIAALQQRATAFTQLQQLRSAQIQQTRNLAIDSIVKQIDPLLAPIATARHCSVVFERTATYGFNPGMDLTPVVVQQLDQTMPTITFNLAPPESVRR